MSIPNGLLLLIPFALLVTASLRLRSKTAYLLSLFLSAYASIILLSEAASLINALRGQFFLGGHFLLVLAAYSGWRRCGRPPLLGPFEGYLLSRVQIKAAVREHWLLTIFAAAVAAAWMVNAWVIYQVPPNNYDGMTYHLARVGYWLQHANLAAWATPNIRQVTSPANAELGILWTMLFSGSDRWAGFIQWAGGWVSGLAIFGIARLLKSTRAQALFAVSAWATFPAIVLQSTSVQNDLITAAFFTTAIYFLFAGLQQRQKQAMLLSGISLGIALGTKVTPVFLVPGLAVALLAALFAAKLSNLKLLLTWGMAAVIGFGIFGTYTYLQNQIVYGGPTGYENFTGAGLQRSRRVLLTANPFLFFYQAIDPSGLPPAAASWVIQAKASLLPPLYTAVGIPISTALSYTAYLPNTVFQMDPGVHEDSAWFGLQGFILLFAACLYQGWQGILKKDVYRLTLIILAASFLLIISMLLDWTPFRGRYFVLTATLVAPLCAFFYGKRRPAKIFSGLMCLIGLWVIGGCVLYNTAKPLVGPQAIWNLDEISLRTLTNPEVEPALRMVADRVPPMAGLGLILGGNGWDYPFWGAHLGRKIVQAEPPAVIEQAGWMESQNLDTLVVGPRQRKFLIIPPGLQLAAQTGSWQFFTRADPAAVSLTRDEQLRAAATDATGLVNIAAGLIGQVGVIETWTSAWPIETGEGHGVLWLGEGEPQAIGVSVWSEKAQQVRIVFDAAAGPGRTDNQRTLAFVIVDETGHRTTVLQKFEGEAKIEFSLPLQAGYNSFGVNSRDQATVRTHPNGDTRQLLVLLRNITIKP